MRHEGFTNGMYYAVYPTCIEFYGINHDKGIPFKTPSSTVHYISSPNSGLFIHDSVVCESTYYDGFFHNKLTAIDNLPCASLIIKNKDTVQQVKISQSGQVYCSISNSLLAVDIENEEIRQVLQEEGRILKFEVDIDIIYCLSEYNGKKNLALYQGKEILRVYNNVIDFVLNNRKLEVIHAKYGQVYLNQLPLTIQHLEKDAFELRCVPVISQNYNLVCLTHMAEPNALYYFMGGTKYKHKTSIPAEWQQQPPQYHFVVREEYTLDYEVLSAQNHQFTSSLNCLQPPVGVFDLQEYSVGRYVPVSPADSLVLSNLKALFINGLINPYFAQHIHTLYNTERTTGLPFSHNDAKPFTYSLNNPYEVFKILVINHYDMFFQAYKGEFKHLSKFSLYTREFLSEMSSNYAQYDFDLKYTGIMENSLNKLKRFYKELYHRYVEELEHVFSGSQELHRINEILSKLQHHNPILQQISTFESLLFFIKKEVSREDINAMIIRHAEAKNRWALKTPGIKTIIEYFAGLNDCMQRETYDKVEFIQKLFQCRRSDIAYLGCCLWDNAQKVLDLTDQELDSATLSKDLLFEDLLSELEITARVSSQLRHKLPPPEYVLSSTIQILLARKFFVAATLILYSSRYNWANDISNFAKAHLQAGKLEVGYLTISGLMDTIVSTEGSEGDESKRQKMLEEYLGVLLESGAVMETVGMGILMPIKDKEVLRRRGAGIVSDIDMYLD